MKIIAEHVISGNVWEYDEADFVGLNAVYDHLCFEELDNINDIVDNITKL